jgi:hypothetical protein
VGITRFQVRRSPADPLGYDILAAVKNASGTPVRCRLEITLDDAPVDILPLRLKPEETWSRALEKTSREGGRLAATLTRIRADEADDAGGETAREPADGDTRTRSTSVNHLLADDAAWAILPARTVQPVLIVSPGNLFLQKVFEANPLVQVQVRQDFPEFWPSGTILVFHRHVPPTLPPGNVLVIDPVDGCDLWEPGEMVPNPIVTDQDRDSPLMTHIRLDNVLMPEARRLRFPIPPRVLAGTFDGDPLYAQIEHAGGKCLLLSVDLDHSDLAFRTAFPILMTNALAWFAGHHGELRESLASGATASVPWEELLEGGGGDLWLSSPSGQLSQLAVPAQSRSEDSDWLPADRAQAVVGPLNEVGIWTIGRRSEGADRQDGASDGPSVELAVNLASEREADLRTPPQWADHRPSSLLAAGWLGRPLWFYLVLAACLLTTFEWFLYQRRWIT